MVASDSVKEIIIYSKEHYIFRYLNEELYVSHIVFIKVCISGSINALNFAHTRHTHSLEICNGIEVTANFGFL